MTTFLIVVAVLAVGLAFWIGRHPDEAKAGEEKAAGVVVGLRELLRKWRGQ